MKVRTLCAAAVSVVALASLALAQTPGNGGAYQPRLGDIMNATQLRHHKLSLAGKQRNWELAAYELKEIRASFEDAATLYPGIPVTNMTIVADPVHQLEDAVRTRDGAAFDRAFVALTNACNGCHRTIGRNYIVIQVPTAAALSNQSFAPAK